jgi:hypothetical protein
MAPARHFVSCPPARTSRQAPPPYDPPPQNAPAFEEIILKTGDFSINLTPFSSKYSINFLIYHGKRNQRRQKNSRNQ